MLFFEGEEAINLAEQFEQVDDASHPSADLGTLEISKHPVDPPMRTLEPNVEAAQFTSEGGAPRQRIPTAVSRRYLGRHRRGVGSWVAASGAVEVLRRPHHACSTSGLRHHGNMVQNGERSYSRNCHRCPAPAYAGARHRAAVGGGIRLGLPALSRLDRVRRPKTVALSDGRARSFKSGLPTSSRCPTTRWRSDRPDDVEGNAALPYMDPHAFGSHDRDVRAAGQGGQT